MIIVNVKTHFGIFETIANVLEDAGIPNECSTDMAMEVMNRLASEKILALDEDDRESCAESMGALLSALLGK